MIVLHALFSASVRQMLADLFPVIEAVLLDKLQQMQLFLIGPELFAVEQGKAG